MQQWQLALTGALPALIAMWYVDRLDRKRPEPRWSLRRVALAGAISVLPCAFLEAYLITIGPVEPYAKAFYSGFVVAAGVEELAKLLCVYWFVWHRPEFDERLDGIVYATRAGLGFALVENIFYLLQTESQGEFIAVYIARALLAVPGHAIWAGFMGYYAARRRFDRRGPGLLGGLLLAIALHGAYDAAVFVGEPLRMDGQEALATALLLVPLLVIVCGGVALRRMARRALAGDDAAAHAAGRTS
jgi:RsiW-degrading membrane proteinase PrsW (M82 family)